MFRTLLAVLVFMVIFIYLSIMNPHKTQVVFAKGLQVELPVAIILVVTAAFGFVLAYLTGLLRDLRFAFVKKRLLQQDSIKEKLVESLMLERRFSPEASKRYLDAVKTGEDRYLLSLYGAFLRETGNVEEAKEIHRECAVKKENNYCLFEFLKDLCKEGRYTEVVALLRDIPKIKLTPSLLLVGIEAAEKAGELDFAVSLAEKLYKLVPSKHTESFYLGLSVERAKAEFKVGAIKKILKKRPGFVPAIKALEEMSEFKLVMDSLQEAYKRTKDATYLIWFVDVMVKEGGSDPRKAMDFMNKFSKSSDESILVGKAYLFAQLGMYEDALKVLGEVRGSEPLKSYVKYLAFKGMGRFGDESEFVEDIARKGALLYRCEFCGFCLDRLVSRCPNCHNFDTLRLEAEGEV